MNQKPVAWRLTKTVLVGIVALLFVLPLFWMLSASLKSQSQVFEQPFRWITERVRWENYLEVWFSRVIPFWRLYLNSFTVCIVGVAGQLVISSSASYAFARINFKGKGIVFALFLTTMMIPVQVTIIPRYMLFQAMGIYNTLWSIILPQFFSVTSIFLLRQFYMALPGELSEAARVDGANHFRIWLQVTMPLTKAAMASVVVLAFINSWNEYLNPLIFLAKKELYTVALGVRSYLYDFEEQYNLMMAAAACAIVPIVVLYLAAQKQFIESIAATGVKG